MSAETMDAVFIDIEFERHAATEHDRPTIGYPSIDRFDRQLLHAAHLRI